MWFHDEVNAFYPIPEDRREKIKILCYRNFSLSSMRLLHKKEVCFYKQVNQSLIRTRAVEPNEFDWETADWMPTPPGQPQIPMPWGGQGSISEFYGLEIVNDFHKKDGRVMVYSMFRDYGEKLVDPYFMLYNIYRGTLRIYFFPHNPLYWDIHLSSRHTIFKLNNNHIKHIKLFRWQNYQHK